MSNDPNRRKPKGPQPGNDDENRKARRIVMLIVAALIATLLINSLYTTISNAYLTEITYTEFKELLASDQISEVEFQSDDRIVILTKDQAEKPKSQQRLYYTGLIPNQDTTALTNQLEAANVKYNRDLPEEVSPIVTFLVSWVLPVVFMYALFSLLMRGMTKKMGGGLGGIGESKAKVYMEKQTGVTFADVAGQDEAKESLVEIIDFLHNPQKYTAIGAKLPKGALLVGSPGTGKTLLAKAVAGEANVPFFSISGSDFVEMFVGVGASRVRDLFQQAAKVAPAIIFIDEIDAIGRTRDSKFGGNDEREQTLNQLLAEIDGFDSSKGVVILAQNQPPLRFSTRRFFARAALTGASSSTGRIYRADTRRFASTRRISSWPRTSTFTKSPRRRQARSARTLQTSSTKRRFRAVRQGAQGSQPAGPSRLL